MTKSSHQKYNTSLLQHVPKQTSVSARLNYRPVVLEIRANLLLVFRRGEFDIHHVIPLTPHTPIKHSSRRLTVASFKFSFTSEAPAASFEKQLLSARKSRTDKYELLTKLGSGATGTVYSARRKSDGAVVAVKRMSKLDIYDSHHALENFINEYVALSSLRSPFLVSALDAFETQSHLNLVMPLAKHGDLQAVLSNHPRGLPEKAARQIFAEVTGGLEDLHRAGYLYRDLKLPNMLLTSEGHVQLADFGLVKKLKVETSDESSSSDREYSEENKDSEGSGSFQLVGRTKSFVGTRRYMSPEHTLRRAKNGGYGAPSDLWALGVSLYLLTTGRYPFGDNLPSSNTFELFDAIRHETLTFPKSMSDELRELLQGLLERDHLERWDIEDIKNSRWMKGMRWSRVRENARRGKRTDEVVEMVEGKSETNKKSGKGRREVRKEELSKVVDSGYLVGFGNL